MSKGSLLGEERMEILSRRLFAEVGGGHEHIGYETGNRFRLSF
jgi:hypothetical protein